MNDVIDAWSEHIYWNYWDHFRMEERLKDVSNLVHAELPESARKPTFILEYGVRGLNACGAETTVTAAYYNDPPACTELRRISLAGFQKVWFTVLSAQLGFDGASNWDLFWSAYDRTKNAQSYWTIGPPEENWALYPTYYAAQLLDQTTARGWQVLAVDPVMRDDEATRYDEPYPDQLEQELTAYHGPDGQLTLVGLDTRGGGLIEPTASPPRTASVVYHRSRRSRLRSGTAPETARTPSWKRSRRLVRAWRASTSRCRPRLCSRPCPCPDPRRMVSGSCDHGTPDVIAGPRGERGCR